MAPILRRAPLGGESDGTCLMLLIGAGMLVRSSIRLLSTDPGFETSTLMQTAKFAEDRNFHEGQRQISQV